jgi:two-component system cell cycle response regulator CpdR
MTHILLAEDDDSLRGFLARALERAGHQVRVCADGDEALEALDDGPYDLLLTDIVMPGTDGIEVARIAAARRRACASCSSRVSRPWPCRPARALRKAPRC